MAAARRRGDRAAAAGPLPALPRAALPAAPRRVGLVRGGPQCARAMARLGAVRPRCCALLLAAALAVSAFLYVGSGREAVSGAAERPEGARARAPAAPSPPAPPAAGAKAESLEGGGPGPVDHHLLLMFTRAEHNAALQAKARVALRSLLRLARFEAHEVLNLHFVSEEASREVAEALLRELLPPAAGFRCKVSGAAARDSWRGPPPPGSGLGAGAGRTASASAARASLFLPARGRVRCALAAWSGCGSGSGGARQVQVGSCGVTGLPGPGLGP
ncbi:Xyloside xylosyltransferase 1 [Galemys pyrenaicus]|uniref:Xyloside xylosyltransferase 1 n=1 Tax=Galemys pyrenaicus TaxID=202257 RepID=A0A8J6DIS0_GALPY|nr:Xyloside xylosyltransferase 1 [Galemys pyrenaicus]